MTIELFKDIVNSILKSKINAYEVDPIGADKAYVPFIVNRSLSYHLDCLPFANEMNQRHHLDKKLQYLFLINSVRGRSRSFQKWIKPESNDDLESIKIYFGFSDAKAKTALKILSPEQIHEIQEKTKIGGVSQNGRGNNDRGETEGS